MGRREHLWGHLLFKLSVRVARSLPCAGFDIKRPVEEATELLTELNHVVSGHGSVGSAACLPSDSLVATAHAVPTVARAGKLRMVAPSILSWC